MPAATPFSKTGSNGAPCSFSAGLQNASIACLQHFPFNNALQPPPAEGTHQHRKRRAFSGGASVTHARAQPVRITRDARLLRMARNIPAYMLRIALPAGEKPPIATCRPLRDCNERQIYVV